jgi:hypothetical protein
MILKLRDGKILISNNTIPSETSGTYITFEYELGTNHYDTVLSVNGHMYYGKNPKIELDFEDPLLTFKVDLYDVNKRLMRTYEGTYNYLKLCLIGNNNLIDIHKQLELLYNENEKLKEKGEVI